MGFRFRKSFKVAPGVKLNFNKKSTGVTFGNKGLHYTINSSGKRTASAGIPGTGLYYTESSSGSGSGQNNGNNFTGDSDYSGMNPPPVNPNGYGGNAQHNGKKPFYMRIWFIILMLFFFAPVGIFLLWKYTNAHKFIKVIVSAIALFWFVAMFIATRGNSTDVSSSDVPSGFEIIEEVVDETDSAITQAEKETEKTTQQSATEKPTNKQPATERTTTPAVKPTKPTEPTTAKPTQAEITYVLSTDTKKYHLPSCYHVKKIKPENYQESKTVPSGYSPCGTCHPDRY